MQIQQEFRIDNETIYAKRLQISIAIENKSLGCFEVYLKFTLFAKFGRYYQI